MTMRTYIGHNCLKEFITQSVACSVKYTQIQHQSLATQYSFLMHPEELQQLGLCIGHFPRKTPNIALHSKHLGSTKEEDPLSLNAGYISRPTLPLHKSMNLSMIPCLISWGFKFLNPRPPTPSFRLLESKGSNSSV